MACIIFYSAVLQCGIPLPFSRILSAFIVLSAVISCSWWLSFPSLCGLPILLELNMSGLIQCCPLPASIRHGAIVINLQSHLAVHLAVIFCQFCNSGCSSGCYVLPICIVGSAVTFCQLVSSPVFVIIIRRSNSSIFITSHGPWTNLI